MENGKINKKGKVKGQERKRKGKGKGKKKERERKGKRKGTNNATVMAQIRNKGWC